MSILCAQVLRSLKHVLTMEYFGAKGEKSQRFFVGIEIIDYLCTRLSEDELLWASLLRPAPFESPRVGTQQGQKVVAAR